MLRADEAVLIAYVAARPDQAAIALHHPDAGAALRALRLAAAEVRRIPHPDMPGDPLPNWCEVLVEDGVPVLHLDMQDHREYAERVVRAVLDSLGAAGVDGSLEPARRPAPSYAYDANADILPGAEGLSTLDGRGLPPGFPAGFPVPDGGTLVLAQRAREAAWEHAAWRRGTPFDEYPDRLREFGSALEPVSGRDALMAATGMIRYLLRHPSGVGSVSLYHEYRTPRRRHLRPQSRWYASVVWQAT